MTHPVQAESLHEAENRFSQIRHMVYRQVERDIGDAISHTIRLTGISDDAARMADQWRYAHDRIPGWSWSREVRKFHRRPRRVEAAFGLRTIISRQDCVDWCLVESAATGCMRRFIIWRQIPSKKRH